MRRYNKRSKMFSLGLAIVLLLVLLEIFYLVNSRMQDLKGRAAIGANDIALFAAIQENEKSMIYGEVGFGLAFQQSLYNIAKGGGTAEESDCGCRCPVWRADCRVGTGWQTYLTSSPFGRKPCRAWFPPAGRAHPWARG